MTLDDLIALAAAGALPIPAEAFEALPPTSSSPIPAWDRVEGMLLGLAIGDSLGNTNEGKTPSVRRQKYGEVRDYLPHRYASKRRVGLPSDDTQMAFWLVEQLVEDGTLDVQRLGDRFATRQIFGIGKTVTKFKAAWPTRKTWHGAGQRSAGNGALMRIAPVLLPHLSGPGPQLWADTIAATAVTHNDAMAVASSVSFVAMLHDLLRAETTPEPETWLDAYIRLARPFEANTNYACRGRAQCSSPSWRAVDVDVRDALRGNAATVDACDRWHSGAYLLETVPTVMFLLARYGDDPEQAIIRAVNDTKDNDTIAAIVGAAVGALHGKQALPARWRDGLLGRLGRRDDGAVFDLLDRARAVFGAPSQ